MEHMDVDVPETRHVDSSLPLLPQRWYHVFITVVLVVGVSSVVVVNLLPHLGEVSHVLGVPHTSNTIISSNINKKMESDSSSDVVTNCENHPPQVVTPSESHVPLVVTPTASHPSVVSSLPPSSLEVVPPTPCPTASTVVTSAEQPVPTMAQISSSFDLVSIPKNVMECKSGGIAVSVRFKTTSRVKGYCICGNHITGRRSRDMATESKTDHVDRDNCETLIDPRTPFDIPLIYTGIDSPYAWNKLDPFWFQFLTRDNFPECYERAVEVLGWQEASKDPLCQYMKSAEEEYRFRGSGGIGENINNFFLRLICRYGPWDENTKKMVAVLYDYNLTRKQHDGVTAATTMLTFDEASVLARKGRDERNSRTINKQMCIVKIGFLISVHEWSEGTEAVTRSMMYEVHSCCHRYLFHVDSSVSDNDRCKLEEFVALFSGAIILPLTESLDGQWGYVSLTMMEIILWAKALHMDPTIDYFINLSGNDFPVQSLESLEEYLSSYETYGKSITGLFFYRPNVRWHYINLCGYNKLTQTCFLLTPNLSLEAGSFWKSGAIKNFKAGYFGGMQWHIIHSDLVKAIIGSGAGVELLFSMTFLSLPDEIFFANILFYFTQTSYHPYNPPAEQIYNNEYLITKGGRFQNWGGGTDGHFCIDLNQFPKINAAIKSPYPVFFARKVYKVRLCDLMDYFLKPSHKEEQYCDVQDINGFLSKIRNNPSRKNYIEKCHVR